jgi:hypothetical protein
VLLQVPLPSLRNIKMEMKKWRHKLMEYFHYMIDDRTKTHLKIPVVP